MKRLLLSCLLIVAAALILVRTGLLPRSAEEPAAAPGVAMPAPGMSLPVAATALRSSTGTLSGGRLSGITFIAPSSPSPAGVVVLFTDPAATAPPKEAIDRLTALGAAVIVIDSNAYLQILQADKGECLWLSSDIEGLNRDLQHRLNFPEFRLPVLASLGESGILVNALLIEAPSYSFAGGVSAGFDSQLPLPPPGDPGLYGLHFCGVPAMGEDKESGHVFLNPHDVAAPWDVIPAAGAEKTVESYLDSVDKAELMPLAAEGELANPVAALADAVKPMLAEAAKSDPNSLQDLPLIEMPPPGIDPATGGPQPYIAIIYSGDGGWRDLDRTLGQVLSAHGVPVVGLDSLLYFWKPKRPEVVAHDLDRIVTHYRKEWHAQKVVLVGYSFGADILPFAYTRLPPETQADVAEISLLSLSHSANFEISVEGYFTDAARQATQEVDPELAKMPPALLQCFYGEDEAEESACTSPAGAKTEVIRTTGGHHFGDDYDALAMRIMEGAAKRLGGR